jgi:hypothetical protein
MIDTIKNRPLRVSTTGTAGPYLVVAADQIAAVTQLLKDHEVYFWTDGDIISVNGKPPFGVINFGYRGNPEQVQQILDAAG